MTIFSVRRPTNNYQVALINFYKVSSTFYMDKTSRLLHICQLQCKINKQDMYIYIYIHTSGKTVSNSKNPGIYSGCKFISTRSQFTIPPSPQSSAGTCTAKAATAMLIYKGMQLIIISYRLSGI